MPKCSGGRHTPAFVLLFLAEEPSYGLELQNKIDAVLAKNTIDCAAIYRTLKNLENTGMVKSSWDTSETGPAKKYYSITEKGLMKLAEYNEDIQSRIANLRFFIQKYQTLQNLGGKNHE